MSISYRDSYRTYNVGNQPNGGKLEFMKTRKFSFNSETSQVINHSEMSILEAFRKPTVSLGLFNNSPGVMCTQIESGHCADIVEYLVQNPNPWTLASRPPNLTPEMCLVKSFALALISFSKACQIKKTNKQTKQK